ncbi:recombination regulator RecX [Nitrosomonas sp. Is37]|uniref:recombination regulator RecX n=1 Tax=Nitrosomonas sp. Is37 TaxID=3080535 RepID=UPI00294AF069|nr:recombination regulator RecX [Nitrosomonas sp. Is37]MDV6345327.1 recombination regulator RecX [Nitrosomonas sp. Is37]
MNIKLSLQTRAVSLLARREYSRLELEKKLASHAQTPEALSEVLDVLEQRGLLSAERLVEQVVHGRRHKYGAQRIRHELKEKGIADHLISTAMVDLKETELQTAREIWRKKFGVIPENLKERSKQARFLAGRGFSAEIIRQILVCSDEEE